MLLALRDADVIISHIEVNDKHGCGVSVGRMFQGASNIISLRSADYYGGCQEFGDLALCVSYPDQAPAAVSTRLRDALGASTAGRILCMPYFADDARTGIAMQDAYGAPMCTYILDDQNVCAGGIPDHLMRELLARSTLRLAVSPEMRVVYQEKYGYPVWYRPPLIPARLMPAQLCVPPGSPDPHRGVIIGNIWGQRWLELLRSTVRESGIVLSWFCNGEFRGLPCDRSSLMADSIIPHDPPPDETLVRILREAWYAVVPSGTLDQTDDRRFIAQLSMPGRLPYLMATANLPILVLGSPETAAARFVKQFGVGLTAEYERASFVSAVNQITQPDTNLAMRKRALVMAGRFTDTGSAEWIWQSLALGQPLDRRFEDLMPKTLPDLSHLLAAKRSS